MVVRKLPCMTRLFPAYRLPQTPNNGWHHHHFVPSRVLKENMVNGSTTSLPVVCNAAEEFHHSNIFNGDNPLAHSFQLIMFNFILVTTITRIVRFLLKPLKQPMLISQIIGGVIVGPSVLGRSKWYQRYMKPEAAQFLANNIGVMGFIFCMFIYGVKLDPALWKKSAGRVHIPTALVGMTIPTIAIFVVGLCMRKDLDKELGSVSSIGVIAGFLGITAFPDLFSVLKELNLLNSDIGLKGLSMAMIGDAIGLVAIVAFEAGKQGENGAENALWYMISLVIMTMFVVFCFKPAMVWINNRTLEGHPVDQSLVIVILLGVFVIGFLTDMFGIAIANGPLWLGIAVPDGPGLGATLENKSRTIMADLLMPFSFIMVGSYIDFSSLRATDWSSLEPLFFMVLVGYLTKFFSTWITAFCWRLPLRDGLTLSLIMSLRGQIEIILFVHLMDKKILKVPGFTLLLVMTTVLTATFAPLIYMLYDPTRPYMLNQRRNIQHHPPEKELRIVLSILEDETINGPINLLDASNPTTSSPLSVYALRVFELVGHANPLFINHAKQEVPHIYQWTHTINTLESYQQLKGVSLKIQFFTAVAPKQSMFQDICELALEHEARLIILPFKSRGVHIHGVRTVYSQVLRHAPCSIAILVDKGLLLETSSIGSSFCQFKPKLAVLFLGGADAREALVYADRMVANQDVSLTVIRFLSQNCEGDNAMEKKLDDGIVTWFWVKNEMNPRVVYREVVVGNGEETIGAILDMKDGDYDLLIVGRKQGINPVLLTGLSEWSESEELGTIGDYVSSEDFSGTASVLVVQQQILRG